MEKKTCSLEHCNLGYYGKGLCKPHYMKINRPVFKAKQLKVERYEGMTHWEFVVAKLGISGGSDRVVKF